MGLVVQKYGGSSVADAESIKRVAKRIVETHKDGNEVVVVVSAMGDTTDELLDLAEQVSPLPPRPRDGHAAHRRRADLHGPAGHGDRQPRPRGAVVHRQPGRHHHRRRRTARPASSTSRRAGSRPRSTRATSRIVAGFQGVSARTPRTSPRSAAAAPTPPPSPSPPRWTPTSARSTPTSTASSPPTRGSCRTPARSTASPTRRCWRWRPAARRSCTCAASSTPAATTSRSTSAPRSPHEGTWVSRRAPAGTEGEPVEAGDHLRRRARPLRGQDHGRRRARTSPARPPRSSGASPTPRSTST